MPEDIFLHASSSSENFSVTWKPPTVSNYHPSKVNLTSNYAPGHIFTVGTWKVIYTAEDYYKHRRATGSFTITIVGRYTLTTASFAIFIAGRLTEGMSIDYPRCIFTVCASLLMHHQKY